MIELGQIFIQPPKKLITTYFYFEYLKLST